MADGDLYLNFTVEVPDPEEPHTSYSFRRTIAQKRESRRVDRGYEIHLYESNLFDNDVHPITGLPTPGIHTKVARLPALDKHFEYALNKPGTWSFRIPLNDPTAMDIVGYEIRRCIVVYIFNEDRRRVPVWSGPIMNLTLNSTAESPSITVTCNGWAQLLYGRECRIPYQFNRVDAGIIASRMLGAANNQFANDNIITTTGQSAEDLTFSVGQFESLLNVVVPTGYAFDDGYPRLNNTWAHSGATSLHLQSTGRNAVAYVVLSPNLPDAPAIDTYKIAPVDASSNYELYAVFNILEVEGARYTNIAINWYDSDYRFVDQYQTDRENMVGEGIINTIIRSPSNASYVGIFISAYSGLTTSKMSVLWDQIILSKNNINFIPTPIHLGSVDYPANPVGADRSVTYQVGQKIGVAIEELSNIEAGFDWDVRIRATNIDGGQTLLRELNIYYREIKSGLTSYGYGRDRPNVIFSHNFGPNNLSEFSETRDASRIANRMNVRSSGRHAMAQDLDAIRDLGLWEESEEISDAGVQDNTLLGYAGAEVAYRAYPVRIYSPQPFPWDGDDSGQGRIPRFGIDYEIGDIVYTIAKNGALRVGDDPDQGPQPIRIFALSGDIDNEGNERLSNFQTTAA